MPVEREEWSGESTKLQTSDFSHEEEEKGRVLRRITIRIREEDDDG